MKSREIILKEEFDVLKNKMSFEDAKKFKDNNKVKFHWKCKKFGDSWETSMYNRFIRERNCPYCSNQEVNKRNCLASTHAHLISEWSSKNKKKPYEVVAGSTEQIFWKCKKYPNHVWEASINSRARKSPTGCPYCAHKIASKEYNLKTEYPKIALDYNIELNKNKPTDVLPGSATLVHWKCDECSYQWQSEIRKRTSNSEKCPQCSAREATFKNCFAVLNMHLMLEWDFEKNNLNPFKITAKNAGSKKIYWICEKKGHSFSSTIYNRIKSKPTGCPYCTKNKTSIENSVYTNSLLTSEWDDERNNKEKYKITEISLKSGKLINWICSDPKCSHKWKATPANRTGSNQTGCPACGIKNNKKGTSKEENQIRKKIQEVFPKTENEPHRLKNVMFNNTMATIDIWITELNIGIEYDPYHTHKGKEERDRKKTSILLENGYRVIRVRQDGLGKINNSDVCFSPKEKLNLIVKKIFQEILNIKGKYLPKKEKIKIQEAIINL